MHVYKYTNPLEKLQNSGTFLMQTTYKQTSTF